VGVYLSELIFNLLVLNEIKLGLVFHVCVAVAFLVQNGFQMGISNLFYFGTH